MKIKKKEFFFVFPKNDCQNVYKPFKVCKNVHFDFWPITYFTGGAGIRNQVFANVYLYLNFSLIKFCIRLLGKLYNSYPAWYKCPYTYSIIFSYFETGVLLRMPKIAPNTLGLIYSCLGRADLMRILK